MRAPFLCLAFLAAPLHPARAESHAVTIVNSSAETIRRIEIGTPSLRWRVCRPDAAITQLQPEHPLLTTPNRITPQDWDGWDKERGLYFAKAWDPAYAPLLSMADPDSRRKLREEMEAFLFGPVATK